VGELTVWTKANPVTPAHPLLAFRIATARRWMTTLPSRNNGDDAVTGLIETPTPEIEPDVFRHAFSRIGGKPVTVRTEGTRVRLLIAEAEDDVRDSLARIVGSDMTFTLVAAAFTADEAIMLANQLQPELAPQEDQGREGRDSPLGDVKRRTAAVG
jgi:hypothetical protein